MWNRPATPIRVAPAGPALAVLLVLAIVAPAGAAVIVTPPSLSGSFDPSVRAAAMGYAGAAVTWGEPDAWANPAALAGVNGIGFLAGYTNAFDTGGRRRDPEADNTFTSQRLLIGGGGVGVSLMGKPISGLGKARVSLPGIDTPPFVTGDGFDQTEGWGVGVSPFKLVDTFRGHAKAGQSPLTSYGDLTLGYQSKSSTASNGSSEFDLADTYDWGVGGRIALARWWGPDATFRLNLSGSFSRVNVPTDESKNQLHAATQLDRTAFALHLSPAPPSARTATPPSLPWWRPGDVPALSIGLAYDHDKAQTAPFDLGSAPIDHYGLELNVFRLLALRVGYVDDPAAEIDGMTYGGGLSLPVGPWGSLGYQLASVPMPEGVDRQFRQGFSVWLDPMRLWNDAR
jgi:hypothetical protein